MNRRAVSNVVLGCGVAAVLAAFACGGDRDNANRTADATGSPAATGQPAAAGADRAGTPGSATSAAAQNAAADENNARPSITLSGCLQKGDGRSEYILTEVSAPRTGVGTSGTTGADAVAKEQIREAEHAYKLAGDRDTLEPLVGTQVRVSGTVERRSKLNEHNADGTLKERDRSKIDDDDLASVHVASVDKLDAPCGAKSGARKR
jgi:hypothetical protein